MATKFVVTMEIADGEDPYIVDGVNTWDYRESPSSKDNPEPKRSTAPESLRNLKPLERDSDKRVFG